MAFASGARHGLSYVAETTFGVTPSTPSMKEFRHTGTTLTLQKQMLESAEIRSDRQIQDARHGNRNVAGNLSFELSFGAFDDWLEAALGGTWATNVLKAGTTPRSFTVERRHTDVGQYMQFTGVVPGTLQLSIQPNAMVTGVIGVVGRDMEVDNSSLGAPTPVAANSPFDSFTGTIEEGGSVIASVTALELNLDNGLDPAFVVGDAATPVIMSGRSNLTGTLTAYFENAVLLAKFLDETESSLEVELEDTAGNVLGIWLPRIKYTGADVPVNGEGGVLITMPFQALLDTTEGTQIVVTRTPA